MGEIACIHIKKTANPIQVQHNTRDLPPDYVLPISAWAHKKGVELSCSVEEAQQIQSAIIDRANVEFEKRRHKGPHFKQPQGWSAVINLKPTHTLKDMEMVAHKLEAEFKWQVIMCARHYDEGHFDDAGNPVINHHGHIEFLPLDKQTGKCVFRDKQRQRQWFRDLQSLVAKWLNMQRGIDKRESKRKRIEPRAWAVMKEEERAKRLTEEQALERETNIARYTNEPLEQARARITKLYHRGFFEKMIDKGKVLVKDLTDVKKAQNEKQQASIAKDKLEQENKTLKASLKQAIKANKKSEEDLNEIEKETLKIAQVCGIAPYTALGRSENIKADLLAIRLSTSKQDIKAFTNEVRRLLRLRKAPAICHAANEQIAKWLQSEIYTLDEVIPVIEAILSNEFDLNAKIERIQREAPNKETKIAQTQEALGEEIEKEIKERYDEFLKNKEQEYQQQRTKDLKDLETKHLNDFNNLCTLVDVPSKDTTQEAKESLESGIKYLKSDKDNLKSNKKSLENDLTTLCELAGGGKHLFISTAKTHLEKRIKALQAQASKTQAIENAKTELEKQLQAKDTTISNLTTKNKELITQVENTETRASNTEKINTDLENIINTAYSALLGTQEPNNKLTTLNKLQTIIQALQEQSTIPNTLQTQEASPQETAEPTMEQEAKSFFENYYAEHKGAILHGFVCREWVFWMDDQNGQKFKAYLDKTTGKDLIQSLKDLVCDDLKQANEQFNGYLHQFGCGVQSMICIPHLFLPKTTELFCLYDTLTPQVPEIKQEPSTALTTLANLEREALGLIARINKIDPKQATEMTAEYIHLTSDSVDRLAGFKRFLENALFQLQQKGLQDSEGKHK
ncbi:hypothetical protein [Helicobacter bizzozeronii]|uniref:hypothetical protein n=1 Tax=Helicobacter bizzozeronii TaxID=56877 RepID=UPI000CF081DA|nr:hypothetical protein [Helicobacter bizzozeronii]